MQRTVVDKGQVKKGGGVLPVAYYNVSHDKFRNKPIKGKSAKVSSFVAACAGYYILLMEEWKRHRAVAHMTGTQCKS